MIFSFRSLLRQIAGIPRQALRINFLRFLWAAIRWTWFALILRRTKTIAGSVGVAETTVAHNLRSMKDLSVNRSLRLVLPLVSIEWVRTAIQERNILTIGPRTEGEIWNLVSWGFRRKNITAVDLISYSPMVQLADMHSLPFPDHSFDIVLAGWVLAYSDRKKIAADEILRVCKPGGLIAIGVEWNKLTPEEIASQTGYIVGSKERLPNLGAVLDLFQGRVDHVYFSHDGSAQSAAGIGDILTIFRTTEGRTNG